MNEPASSVTEKVLLLRKAATASIHVLQRPRCAAHRGENTSETAERLMREAQQQQASMEARMQAKAGASSACLRRRRYR